MKTFDIRTFTNQKLLELGFAFLRGRIGRKFAKHDFFGRGSFPHVEIGNWKAEAKLFGRKIN